MMFAAQVNRPCMRYIVNFNNTDYEPSQRFPELWDNETLDFQLDHVEFSFSSNAEKMEGKGKLYVTSKRVLWISKEKAFDFDVPFITLHAVSKDPQTYPKHCIYCQVDIDEADIDNDEDNELVTEFFLVPEEEKDLSSIFDALSHAALVNPDPDEDEDGNDDFIFNPDEMILNPDQARVLDHLESVFNVPEEFEQHEEMEEVEQEGQPQKYTRLNPESER
jgi:nucleotide-sensitive chloride channel 1A